MIRSVPEARRLLLAIAGLFVIVLVVAIGLLLSPSGRSGIAQQEQKKQLQAELLQKRKDDLPARDMDARLDIARKQVATFYTDRFPQRYADVSESLGKLAASKHVQLSSIKYEAKPTDFPGLDKLNIALTMNGDYRSDMEFINALERDKTLFIIDQVNFGGLQNNQLRVDVRVETYLRNAGQ